MGSVPGCGSAIGKLLVSLVAGAGGGGAVAPAVGAEAGDDVPPVLANTAARNRCAVLSVVFTSPSMISDAVTPDFL